MKYARCNYTITSEVTAGYDDSERRRDGCYGDPAALSGRRLMTDAGHPHIQHVLHRRSLGCESPVGCSELSVKTRSTSFGFRVTHTRLRHSVHRHSPPPASGLELIDPLCHAVSIAFLGVVVTELSRRNAKSPRSQTGKPAVTWGFSWWAIRDSNPRPLPCEGRPRAVLDRVCWVSPQMGDVKRPSKPMKLSRLVTPYRTFYPSCGYTSRVNAPRSPADGQVSLSPLSNVTSIWTSH